MEKEIYCDISKKNQRIAWVDLLKGIAIIFVILGHIGQGLEKSGITSFYSIALNNFIYSFHMPMMFILSGYLRKGGGGIIKTIRIQIINFQNMF